MTASWLLAHLVAVAALAGVGWAVQLVVYPAFRLVGVTDWARYHAAHTRAITRVVALPWLVQGVSTAALLVVPPAGGRLAAAVLAALAAGHGRRDRPHGGARARAAGRGAGPG